MAGAAIEDSKQKEDRVCMIWSWLLVQVALKARSPLTREERACVHACMPWSEEVMRRTVIRWARTALTHKLAKVGGSLHRAAPQRDRLPGGDVLPPAELDFDCLRIYGPALI